MPLAMLSKLPVTTACDVVIASPNLHSESIVIVPPEFSRSCFEQAAWAARAYTANRQPSSAALPSCTASE